MTDRNNLLTPAPVSLNKACMAYLSFCLLFCGSSLIAAKFTPGVIGQQVTQSLLMVWALLFMAGMRTARHFTNSPMSVLGGTLLPVTASAVIVIGYARCLVAMGFKPVLPSDGIIEVQAVPLAAELGSIAIIAVLGAFSSAIVRLIVWDKFEMTPTFSK